MILSYRDLVATWKRKQLRFDPDISESQIGLSSIDLRLGHVFARLKPSPGIVVQPARGFDPTDHVEIEDASKGGFLSGRPIFRLPPGEFRLAFTLEEVTLPPGLAASTFRGRAVWPGRAWPCTSQRRTSTLPGLGGLPSSYTTTGRGPLSLCPGRISFAS